MFGAVDWQSLHVAGAFVLGAVFATIACLRIVRAVATLFEQGPTRRRRRRDDPDETANRDSY